MQQWPVRVVPTIGYRRHGLSLRSAGAMRAPAVDLPGGGPCRSREGLPLVARGRRTLVGTVRPIGLGAEHLTALAVDRDILHRAAGIG